LHEVSCVATTSKGTYRGSTSATVVLCLGDTYQGGKIFYLESSGEHGFISSTEDLYYNDGSGIQYGFSWGAYGLNLGTTKNNGETNTKLMATNSTSIGQAGYSFKNGLNYNGYSDWYIPSLNELELLKENNAYVGTFEHSDTNWKNFYWSSTERSETIAFCENLYALAGNTSDKSYMRKIRPIRKF
jgi:hypothetical protein